MLITKYKETLQICYIHDPISCESLMNIQFSCNKYNDSD
jgi:hypothetical protein